MTMADSDENPQQDLQRRGVRSYVIRAGRATAAQQRALDQLWPRYGIPFENKVLDFAAVFGRSAPVMLESGFGAGEALLSYAQNHPDVDCVGIEVHPPGVGRLLLGLDKMQLSNVRVIMHDPVEVPERQIAPASISMIHISCPDPWPKKRHHKRRLIQPPFVALLARALRSGGLLRLATDWEHYAHQMREVIDASPEFENRAGAAGFVPRPAERPLTRFEQRGQRLGHAVWDLEYVRR